MKRNPIAFLSVAVGFFALYALTAQRGLGWGDSGEFHYRILSDAAGAFSGCESFATAHPLYVALAKALCSTPFQVTLLSSFFGALAVVGFYLCTGRMAMTLLFGLSHMLWRMSCLAEVQTMNLAFTVFETFFFLRAAESRRFGDWFAALLLAGLHLNVHNFALLALPVYVVFFVWSFRGKRLWLSVPALAVWAAGASPWLRAIFIRGAKDVLVGGYGAQVGGILPANGKVACFNFALASLSFFVPAAIAWWNRRDLKSGGGSPIATAVWALFAVNAFFFGRYFVPDQATFLLPTLFFAYLLVARFEMSRDRAISLAAMQLFLPVMAYMALSQVKVPAWRSSHPYRDEAAYFALPWKFNDDSADRCAAQFEGAWKGYWDCSGKERGL